MATASEVLNNQSATQSASNNSASSASSPPGIEEMLFGDPFTLIIIAAVALAIGILGAIVYVIFFKETEEEYEEDDLEDIILPEVKGVVQKYGKTSKNKVHRDLVTIGEAYKVVRFTEQGKILEEIKNNSDIEHDFENIEIDEKELSKLYNEGIYRHDTIERIIDDHDIPHRLIMIRPHKFLKKIGWFLTDQLWDKDKKTDYQLLPEHMIKQNPDGSLSIARSMELRPFAGLEVPLYFETFGILHSVVSRHLYAQALENQVNYAPKMNFFDSKFSQRLQRMEKEAEIESAKYKSDVAGDVNKS